MQSIIIHVPTQQSVKFPVNMFVWADDGIKILTVLFVRANSSKWIWIYWLLSVDLFLKYHKFIMSLKDKWNTSELICTNSVMFAPDVQKWKYANVGAL